jgi:hypothetical protein
MATLLAFLLVAIGIHPLISADISGQPNVTHTRDGLRFIATIMSICQDPIEGYLLRCQAGTSTVLIWENDVRNLAIGAKYRILCTFVGPMKYPSGPVNVYVAIVWERIE